MMKKMGLPFMLLHLVLIFGYLAPTKHIHEVWKYWSVMYCFPMWNFSANLFAPVADSYIKWYVEQDDCTWQPVEFVSPTGTYIAVRLQNRIGEFISYDYTKSLRDRQLNIARPKAETFKLVRYYVDGRSDTSLIVIPKPNI